MWQASVNTTNPPALSRNYTIRRSVSRYLAAAVDSRCRTVNCQTGVSMCECATEAREMRSPAECVVTQVASSNMEIEAKSLKVPGGSL
jgi:hypothetical protein